MRGKEIKIKRNIEGKMERKGKIGKKSKQYIAGKKKKKLQVD